MSKSNEYTEDVSLEAMKNINPVLFDLIVCNSTRGSRISELKKLLNYDTSRTSSAPKYIEKSPLTHRTMERKRKAEGKLPELKLDDSGTFITGIQNNESKSKSKDRSVSCNDQLRESLMREITPPFKARKTSKTSEDTRRKPTQDVIEIAMSNYTEQENIKLTKLMNIYDKKQISEIRASPALVNILRYIEEAKTPRDRSLFWEDYEYIQKMIVEEREPFSTKKEKEKKLTTTKKIIPKKTVNFKEHTLEPINMFERDLPKALRQRITEIKNNPAFMTKLEEIKRSKKKNLPIIQEEEHNDDHDSRGDEGLEEGAEDIPFLGPIGNNEISNIILLLLKKERTIQLFDTDTRNDFYVFLDQSRLHFWQSLVLRSNFVQNLHSKFKSNRELGNTKQTEAQKPKELEKFSRKYVIFQS
ncbi:predicted protein [Naegleria gruberi]|uniref:Predicted protein n=1 Tax=Naegleria gruberi TaxID=5762 RepID=D2V5X1_NAEGR|nr:uncharacterized protein NAEGRDRAFT_64231 [Naegleria gruberi]EFC47724.1 predicted protein [Naegleria gruberi]|eukprot:XP_002680468.1 predicted protein [Naegleria gruberi strain NEG-M]